MRNTIVALIFGLVTTFSWGDQLVILGGQNKEGTFSGFDNGRILFRPDKGKFMKEQPSRVSKLVLANPTKASYTTTDGKTEEDVTFKGYEKGKFLFVKDGKDVAVMAIKMKTLDPVFKTGGGGGQGGGEYPIPFVDISNFGNVTPEQQAVIDRYTAAKKVFDEFVAVSITMNQEKDRLTGAKRVAMEDDLRRRKEAEQPVKRVLVDSYKALVNTFSEQEDEAAKPVAKPPSKAVGGLRSLSK
jgi:hypothetical protein